MRLQQATVAWMRWQPRWLCMPAALLGLAFSAHAQLLPGDVMLPPTGGGGGGVFVARCAQDEVLGGFDLRTGDDVDAIKPVCISASGGQSNAYPSYFGGNGGGPRQLLCPHNVPVVTGMYVGSEGAKTEIVNNIHLFCGVAAATQMPSEYPAAVFDGPTIGGRGLFAGFSAASEATQRCPAGLVAVGINGRYGVWLDAVGLVCGAPPVAPVAQMPPAGKPPVALGKVKTHSGQLLMKSGRSSVAAIADQFPQAGEPPICASARSARARNSPAAPGLEAQCAAARAKAAATPTPIPAPTPAASDATFKPPMLTDGVRLWACVDRAEGNKNGGKCTGVDAGRAYCHKRGYSGSLQAVAGAASGVVIETVPGSNRIRAVNGDACKAGNCTVVSELHCVP